jgi:hypothetical protein
MRPHAAFATLAGDFKTSGGRRVEMKELLAKLDLIEEQARLTVEALPQLAKERQRMIIALVKQIRWALGEGAPQPIGDPEATVRMPS